MKKLLFLGFALLVVLACSSLGTKWETVSEDGITIEMPGKPTKQAQSVPTASGNATGQMLTVDKGAEAYIRLAKEIIHGTEKSSGARVERPVGDFRS